MHKTFSLLFALLLFVSCGKSSESDTKTQTISEAVTTKEIELDTPNVPAAALNFEVKLNMDNFDQSQEVKVLTAAQLIKKVVASEAFKNAILNHKFKGKKRFANNEGRTNAEIYEAIIEGSERLNPGSDNVMDLELEVFNRRDNTVGYTFPDENRIWMNARFLNRNTPAKVTTNMMHEWLHKLGFEHSVRKTSSRKYSVPYAVGYIVARLAIEHL